MTGRMETFLIVMLCTFGVVVGFIFAFGDSEDREPSMVVRAIVEVFRVIVAIVLIFGAAGSDRD